MSFSKEAKVVQNALSGSQVSSRVMRYYRNHPELEALPSGGIVMMLDDEDEEDEE